MSDVTELRKEVRNLNARLNKLEVLMTYQEEKPPEPEPEVSDSPESLFKQGIRWYIGEKKRVHKLSALDYVKWYDCIAEFMQIYKAYVYDDVLFVKAECDSPFTFCSHSTNDAFHDRLVFNIFEKGWTHEETKILLILHPEEPNKSLELDKSEATEGKHSWTSLEIDDDYYVNGQLIIFGMK